MIKCTILLVIITFMTSCDCDRELACDSIANFQDDNNVLDSISLVIPNAVLNEEVVFNFVHIGQIGFGEPKRIESYEFELDMDDVFSFSTSDSAFIINGSIGSQITIPKDLILQGANFTEGYADFVIKLFIEGESGFIALSGEVLFVTCASLNSDEVDAKDCRYSYDLIPSGLGGVIPFPCQ